VRPGTSDKIHLVWTLKRCADSGNLSVSLKVDNKAAGEKKRVDFDVFGYLKRKLYFEYSVGIKLRDAVVFSDFQSSMNFAALL